jgi:hypothetical protein
VPSASVRYCPNRKKRKSLTDVSSFGEREVEARLRVPSCGCHPVKGSELPMWMESSEIKFENTAATPVMEPISWANFLVTIVASEMVGRAIRTG